MMMNMIEAGKLNKFLYFTNSTARNWIAQYLLIAYPCRREIRVPVAFLCLNLAAGAVSLCGFFMEKKGGETHHDPKYIIFNDND